MCPYIDTYTVVNSGNVLPHVTLRIQSSKKKKKKNTILKSLKTSIRRAELFA